MHVRRWPLVWFYLVALAVIAVDQLTKAWATAALRPIGRMVIIPGFLNLRYLDGGNTGVAFGMFAGHGFLVGLFMIVLAGDRLLFHARAELGRVGTESRRWVSARWGAGKHDRPRAPGFGR